MSGAPLSEAAQAALRSPAVHALVALVALGFAAERFPGMASLRFLSPRVAARPPEARDVAAPAPLGEASLEVATDEEGARETVPPGVRGAPRGPVATARTAEASVEGSPGAVAIEAPPGALDGFFGALARAERGEAGATVRILHLGDSMVASDFGTGTLRRKLQARFGDAGHGFVLPANAWPQYRHDDVFRRADRGFTVSRIVGPRIADGLYGLGGVSFRAAPGLRTVVGTTSEGAHGRRVSRFGIAYLAEPGGGTIDVSVDGERLRVVDTAAPARRALFEAVEVSDGEHRLELLTGRGSVRLFGLTLERDVPGVVLDAIGVVGARLRTFAEIEPAHLAEAVAWRRPSLITFQFGANESGDGFAIPMPEYHAGMADMIRRFRAAAPGASCLVIGVMDRARKEGDRLVTVPVIPHLAREQRAVAAELGCAHYSGFDLMGGEGGMARWVRKGLGAGDFTHPTSQGAAVLGEALHDALMRLYESSSAKNAPR